MKLFKQLFLLFIASSVLVACSSPIPTQAEKIENVRSLRYAPLKQEMSKFIIKGMNQYKVTGMSVALIDEGEVVWAQGFGYQDKLNNKLATADTLYKAGSISKVFTATALMQLVEQGKVDLDAPIQTYIPELKPKYHFKVNDPITLRLIMSHRSGLSGDMAAGMWSHNPERFDNEIKYLNTVHSPYAPGTMTAYSNIATDLMGVVIERVSGEKFEDYIDKHILTPLNMHESTFSDREVNQLLMSKGYKDGEKSEEYPLRSIPAGNLYTNVMELGRFANMVTKHGQKIITPETMQAMLAEQTSNKDLYKSGTRFGLNWIVKRPGLDYLGKVAWHNGGTVNFRTSLIILPQQALSVVVLSNSVTAAPLVEESANKILQQAALLKNKIPVPKPMPVSAQIHFPEPLLETMPGTYTSMLGTIKVNRSGDKLKASLPAASFYLKYHDDEWMSLHYKLWGLIPIPVEMLEKIKVKSLLIDGNTVIRASAAGNEIDLGKKIQPSTIPDSWKTVAGEYTAESNKDDWNMMKNITLGIEDGFLLATVKVENMGEASSALRPISDDMAIVEGIGRGMQETIYLKYENGQPVFSFMGIRFFRDN